MKVGYTEFSFGYAFTENLIRSSSTAPLGAPIFPNLIQEGQWGFDIKINFPAAPLFLQYKLPDLMKRGTAFEIADLNCRGLTIPFFRIGMMRRDISRQHQLLMQLESRYPSRVFYAAPCLDSALTFDRAYNKAEVASRSVFFSPTEIGPLPDNKVHSIAYKQGLSVGYFCSELKEIQAMTLAYLLNRFTTDFDKAKFETFAGAARDARETVLEFASQEMRLRVQEIDLRVKSRRRLITETAGRTPEDDDAINNLIVAREIARVDMGVDLLVAQPQ